MAGKLYLIPSAISNAPIEEVLPGYITSVINNITYYIVENERTGRRMLIRLGLKTPIDELTFFVLNKHTDRSELPAFFDLALGSDIGLLSEAGLPAIADPGSDLVLLAHRKNIEVVPLVGPSSILMAMMASGLNGQNFAFNGYLPVASNERIRRIRQLEQYSLKENQSQIFIETPYRNNQLIGDILKSCSESTLLCIATDITSNKAMIKTHSIAEWKNIKLDLNKRPSIFILHKGQ